VKPILHTQAPLQSLPVPSDCWCSVSIDYFLGLLRTAAGHDGVLVFVGRLSKMVHLAPVSDTCAGSDCVRLSVDEVSVFKASPNLSCRIEILDSLVTFGKVFSTSWEQDSTCRLRTIRKPTVRPSAPTALSRISSALTVQSIQDPGATLPMVEFAVNNAAHAPTGLSRFYINGLRHPALPLCLMGGYQSGEGGARQLLASQLDEVTQDG
jgi:hypothetical protein